MGGRGYHNDVQGYLNSSGRTSEYVKVSEISTDKIDFIIDSVQPKAPLAPEFSNTENKTYVLLDKNAEKIKSITVYDEIHEQKFSIHLDHNHGGKKGPHVHSGMNAGRKDILFTSKHQKIIDEVKALFKKWRKYKMLKEDFDLEYNEFLKRYVISPDFDFTISFSYKGKHYQFDYVGVPKNKNGTTAYVLLSYESDWDSNFTKNNYKSLKAAIDAFEVDGLTFEDVYNSAESELIDAS